MILQREENKGVKLTGMSARVRGARGRGRRRKVTVKARPTRLRTQKGEDSTATVYMREDMVVCPDWDRGAVTNHPGSVDGEEGEW
jgi:hypothetical protein